MGFPLPARKAIAAAACAAGLLWGGPAEAKDPLAKLAFGAMRLPAAGPAQSIGFYSKGCFAGGVGLPLEGTHWQVMRPSRNRRWGHPNMIAVIEKLAQDGVKVGWNGLLVGDISQPRGGPMVTGHASHQIGLDADIWFMPMPRGGYSMNQRETVSAISVLKPHSLYVDQSRWTAAYTGILKTAASEPEIERILVHPGVKKELCDTVKGDRRWLSKIRPFWGHDDHFHIRIGCQPGSPQCKEQWQPTSDGCDKSLAWWFTDEPWRPAKNPKPKARDVMRLSALPKACLSVLDAPAAGGEAVAATSEGDQTQPAPAAAPAAYAPTPPADIPFPSPRPAEADR
jgi:penicillin-insensitive murein endopeptidase